MSQEGRFICHTLAYNYFEVIEEGIRQALKTANDKPSDWFIVDCNFPYTTSQQLIDLALHYDLTYIKSPKNFGVAGNWNWVAEICGLRDNDILMGIDPDSRIQTEGWDSSLIDAFYDFKDAAYICLDVEGLANSRGPDTLIGSSGVEVYKYKALTAWTVGAFNGEFMNKCKLGQYREHYGYIEHYCSAKMREYGMNWYALKDVFDKHFSGGGELREWKNAQVKNETKEDFSQWLKKQS